jgi:hypothetical protein
MFDFSKHLRRRVFISHRDDHLTITIQRNNDLFLNITIFTGFTIGFGYMCTIFIPAFFRVRSLTEWLALLPFAGFVVLWYTIGYRIFLWRSFGVEEVVISQGILHWRRKASWWKRNFEAAESEITDVISKTPWHGLSNHVEFVYRGRSYSIGDMISHDEAHEITHVLGGALGLRQHS